MSALVRRMSALLIQPKGSLLRFSAVAEKSDVKQSGDVEKKSDKTRREKQNFTNVEGLKQFFDEDNFFEDRVRSGRSWNLDELRIKSNSDLHKLWYVLLKEKNMLLTLQAAAKEAVEVMPNEERIDRVEISMENLELVVRERNKAYFDLEVGETGEQPVFVHTNWMGLQTLRVATPHYLPQRYNKSFNERHPLPFNDRNQSWFLNHYREKRSALKRRESNRATRHVCRLLRRNPNADIDALRERYPTVDVDAEKARLHYKGEI
ncbi:39S ribosomal protein L47, mitochondrial [Galendromus occidentalis]|uniref:Large ribosomal subunit protein uL29m n=1 Tax=Galendromus occidentalis TaxID=34638 RepID=A0AAJ6QWG4_9ACAR|nr:39S ribosomal protein L47, mitochondrial [Galendromus occidentalis]